jgi:branched-chain amino acid transport system substrate-binding protein
MSARSAWLISSLAGVVALSCAVALPAIGQSVPGVTNTEITIGGTHPFSGPASAYSAVGKGAQAYFSYINDTQGGVYGRKIVYLDRDDAYNPPQALQLVKQLVEQDHVFCVFNTLGTPPNTALRPYLNENKVPQLWISTGATKWVTEADKYPWTTMALLDYQAESIIYAKYLLQHDPNAKIGVLYQNDDYGQDYLNGLTKGLGAKANLIVKTASYEVTDPDVGSQVATLKGAGADTFFIFATPKFSVQALVAATKLSWKPTIYLNSVSNSQAIMKAATANGSAAATNGVLSVAYVKDPSDPAMANDRGILLYKQIMAKYLPGTDPNDVFYTTGMDYAYMMVDTLKHAGKNLTREGVLNAAIHLHETDNPFLLPGVTISMSPEDRFPIREARLIRYDNGTWVQFGSMISARK